MSFTTEPVLAPAQRSPELARASSAPAPLSAGSDWQRRYSRLLVGLDAVVLVLATSAAVLVRFGQEASDLGGLPYALVGAVLIVAWVITMALGRCYEPRFLGHGAE